MRIMQHLIRITAIRDRADRLKLSLKSLCDLAEVDHASVYRWLGADVSPRLKTYDQVCARLEARLDAYETELLGALLARHGGQLAATTEN